MQLACCRGVGATLAVVLTLAITACSEPSEESTATPFAQIVADGETAPAPNGIDRLPPGDVIDRVIKNLDNAGTYRVSGTTLAGSTIDISFKSGKGSVGTVTTKSEVKLVASEGKVYITSDPKTLAKIVDADIEDTIADKWLLISEKSSSNFKIFADGTTFAQSVLGSQIEGDLTSVQDVGGVPAVGLLFGESGGTLWIAAEGDALPLRFEEKGASAGSGVLTFTDFGKKVKVNVPDEDDIVDPSKLPSEDEKNDDDG